MDADLETAKARECGPTLSFKKDEGERYIRMSDGTWKRMDDLEPGDPIWALDGDGNQLQLEW